MLANHTLDASAILRKAQTTGLLEYVCQELELSDTQFKLAQDRYGSVGTWLAQAENYITRSAIIYPQGSVALGTTVKPIGRDEYDLDLVCLVGLAGRLTPIQLKKTIGDRLRLNGRYRDILEEKPRCWRLNYAGDFHLDITPSIPNPECSRGGELVPDKHLCQYKPTNPKGYRDRFEAYARLQPRIVIEKMELADIRAQIEALPAPTRFRGLLCRCVQLCKRNRDVYFLSNPDVAPISIIITTLAAKSYAYCVGKTEYETELDVLFDVVKRMTSFIETTGRMGESGWFVWNETTDGENFAEKWNEDPALPAAFFAWHGQAMRAFEQLTAAVGMDKVSKQFSEAFGDVGARAIRKLTENVSAARAAGRLAVLPAAGLVGIESRGTLEQSTGKRVVENFDLIAGTSTGGIIALGLGLGLSAQTILDFYVTEGPGIFEQEASSTTNGIWLAAVKRYWQMSRHWIRPKYGADKLHAALSRALGERRLGDSDTRLLIPAFNPHRRTVHVFKTSHHEHFTMDWGVSAVEVALATAAAPTYFPSHMIENGIGLLDGGLWANNPVGLAVVEAIGVLDWPPDELWVLSIGCSEAAIRIPLSTGLGSFARCAIEVMMLGQSRAAIGTAKLLTRHSAQDKRLYRYDTVVPAGTFRIDSVNQIGVLKGLGAGLAREALPEVSGVFFQHERESFIPFHGPDQVLNGGHGNR